MTTFPNHFQVFACYLQIKTIVRSVPTPSTTFTFSTNMATVECEKCPAYHTLLFDHFEHAGWGIKVHYFHAINVITYALKIVNVSAELCDFGYF